MKTGLVMEGGAMRGMFTAGVIDILMENGIVFDGAIGVSAGAVFGCNYKSRQIGRAIRYNTKYCGDPRYCSFRSLLKTGDLFGTEFCYRELPEKLDPFDVKTYRENPMEFYVVATDVSAGEAVYHRCDRGDREDLEWFRASASMPLASRMVELEGKKLLDGGIARSIPLEWFEKQGYDRNVVILTQPEGYVKRKNKALPIMKLALRKYPGLLETMKNRHRIYNREKAYVMEKARRGEVLVIQPAEPLPIGRIERDPEKLRTVYDLGRQAGVKHLENIRAFLKGN